MPRSNPYLSKLKQICLALPETKLTMTWGKPHFRVNDKIFAGFGEQDGLPVIGCKLKMDHADVIIRDPRFWRAKYVGHAGWISMDASKMTDWDDVRDLIHESYRLIAPKRAIKKMEESGLDAVAPPTRATVRPESRRPARPTTPRALGKRK